MECSLVLLAFLMIIKMSACIKCYKCSPDVFGEHPCRHFNQSDVFQIVCEHSSMCHKRETMLDVSGNHMSVLRGCAGQTIPGEQQKINGKWLELNTIYEAYSESCQVDSFDPDSRTRQLNCYCRGDLCNSADRRGLHPILYLVMLYLARYLDIC